MYIQSSTRACSAALFPVCGLPSSLRIFFRSLLMSLLERSVTVAALSCRGVAMAGVEDVFRGVAVGKVGERVDEA